MLLHRLALTPRGENTNPATNPARNPPKTWFYEGKISPFGRFAPQGLTGVQSKADGTRAMALPPSPIRVLSAGYGNWTGREHPTSRGTNARELVTQDGPATGSTVERRGWLAMACCEGTRCRRSQAEIRFEKPSWFACCAVSIGGRADRSTRQGSGLRRATRVRRARALPIPRAERHHTSGEYRERTTQAPAEMG